ncbi:MAG: nickel-dependent hydrogenase large subunit [Candidatus Geothermincolia bacterium]
MAQIISIDPVTRIEGHMRIDVEVEGGVVKDAWSSGTMFRGYEMLIKEKHPWDAQQVMERICGVCPLVHGTAASYALDTAMGVTLPENARLIRNLALGANFIQSHILHFYHLQALDYIDVTAVTKYSGGDPALKLMRDKITALAAAKDLYPFMPRYESPDYIGEPGGPGDPNIATELVGHYVQAFEMRKKAQEMLTIFYGRMPSFVGTIPGGVTTPPTLANIAAFRSRLHELQKWIAEVYLSDVKYVATTPAYAAFIKAGDTGGNFLAYGGMDQNQEGTEKYFKPGVISDYKITEPAQFDRNNITESVWHSWYDNSTDNLKPAEGKTEPQIGKPDAYSFLKAPRYSGKPMEVGPLARQLMNQDPAFMDLATQLGVLTPPVKLGIIPRTGARAVECLLLSHEMDKWLDQLTEGIGANIWDPKGKEIPNKSNGAGLVEGPRGALGHWISIDGGKTANYQAVVPTTWNAAPRDKAGVRGPMETSLIGIPVPDPNNPINVVRCIRSFDPCLACAIHVIHPEHNGVKEFRVI